jgi:hypothetical protein
MVFGQYRDQDYPTLIYLATSVCRQNPENVNVFIIADYEFSEFILYIDDL